MMNKKKVLESAKIYIQKVLKEEGAIHDDWWHVYRVLNTAKTIQKTEKGSDPFIVELATILHDLANRKSDEDNLKVRNFLVTLSVDKEVIDKVCRIIQTCSYTNSFGVEGKIRQMETIEGKIVQDAVRLDAVGAIGVGRAFAYGGQKGIQMYNPEIKPSIPMSMDQYVNNRTHTINHFYEKLLLLKDLMNTKTGKEIAVNRHEFMLSFLKEYFAEFNGER